MGRASMKTLKETTYISFLKVAKLQGLQADVHFQITSPQHKDYPNCILFPNRSIILMKDLDFYPSDPDFDELGSLEITGGFIDEGNQVTQKAKNILASRMRHNITEYGIVPKLLITCNPAKNWVYHEFYKPSKDGSLPEYRQFVQSLVTDNPDIDPTYYKNLLKLDKNSRERLLNGNWEYDDDPSVLIAFENIINCFTNDFVEPGQKYLTCDVARFGADTTVITLWDGWRGIIHQFKGLAVNEVADKIQQFRAQYGIPMGNVVVDEDGVGGGVVDILKCKGFVNNSRPLDNPKTRKPENFDNLKSQCYFGLAEKINANEVYLKVPTIEAKEKLIQELEWVRQFQMDKDGKRRVLPKDKVKEMIGRSPDLSDSLMMRFYFELAPKLKYFSI